LKDERERGGRGYTRTKGGILRNTRVWPRIRSVGGRAKGAGNAQTNTQKKKGNGSEGKDGGEMRGFCRIQRKTKNLGSEGNLPVAV